jgi:hypothetical protein
MSWLFQGLEFNRRTQEAVRIYYKFDTGRWQARRTRQLQKVYRCR